MNGARQVSWADSNQRYLAATFVRLKALLGDGELDRAALDVEAIRASLPGPAAIDVLAGIFGLSGFERDLLLLAAGVEMDAGLAELCGARGAHQRPWATFGLALAALPRPHWSALAPVGPLRRWRLLEVDESAGLASARLRVDERILHYLSGINYLDPRLQSLLRVVEPPRLLADRHRIVAEEIARLVRERSGGIPPIQLIGDDPHGQEDVAAHVSESAGLRLHVLAAADLPAAAPELDALITLWQRDGALMNGALMISRPEGSAGLLMERVLDRLGGLVFLASRSPVACGDAVLRFEVDKPDAPDQRRLWQAALGPGVERWNGALDGVVGQYRLSARTIAATAARFASGPDDIERPGTALLRACRGVDAVSWDALAQRIAPTAGWDDLILPDGPKETLRQIASHVRHRLKVYHEWGFAAKSARGLGISALFSGESGTGKTMAAEVLAGELELDLYRIDLSAVVSKYIGETEKNLRRVFDAAEETGAVLLFDEADALFGKRSEVRDSHDRYANIEVSYLLQRMEAYRGLAILTTNQKAALDAAFQRRLRFVVPFPFPDASHREAIWRRIFPAATPIHGVSYEKLARLNAAGGQIRNIALSAAFLAADSDGVVSIAHLLRAAHLEAAKRERPITEAEVRGWE